jgi:enoyl-CoA hydratase/carnithine racemase
MEDDDAIAARSSRVTTRGRLLASANLRIPARTMASAADFIKSISKRRGRAFEVLGNFPKPIVGAVNGFAVGIGCIVTFCCDLLVASERAEWRLPQVTLGILPAYGGSTRLARWVGRGNAMRLAMGFPLTAQEAQRIGLAQWVVPHGKLMDQAMESPATSRRCRRSPRVSRRNPFSRVSTFQTCRTPRSWICIVLRRSS